MSGSMRNRVTRRLLAAGALATATLPVLATLADAQTVTTRETTTTTTTTTTTDAGGDYRNPPPPPRPAGYTGGEMPPVPEGYVPPADPAAQQAADAQYAQEAQRWAAQNCVKSRKNTAAGVLVGGILGAIVGGAIAGPRDAGLGVVAGATVGAVGGAAVADSSQGDTSPGCPPGYVTRSGAAPWGYAPTAYYYGAPDWYVPWVFVNGYWAYRPYPYHDWYYRTYYRGPGWHGGPGWRGGPGYRGPGGWHGGGHWGPHH